MSAPGTCPPLSEFLRWCAEMPAVFRGGGGVRVRAVVADLMATLFGEIPRPEDLEPFSAASSDAAGQNRLRWVLAACHVLWHPALRGTPMRRAGIEKLLVQELSALAQVANPGGLATQQERREELVRRVLRAAGLRLPGEGERQGAERLGQVDSVERRRLEGESARREAAERRRREEEMRKRAAEEAASKANYE